MRQAAGISGNKYTRLAALALFVANPCWALFNDTVEVWAAENFTWDSNLLRLSKDIDPASVGAPQRSDRFRTDHLGANASLPVSLQKFEVSLDWYSSHYDKFTHLDFTGHNARANWAWVVNPEMSGTLGYTDATGLSSFNNIQANVRDVVTTRGAYATANWQATPRYRVSGATAFGRSEHSDVRAVQDIETAGFEAGVHYVTPKDDTAGIVARFERGRRPGGLLDNGILFENAYRQYGIGAAITWIATPHSRFEGRFDWVHRLYDQASERNYSGPIVRALYTWTPTVKTTVAASLYRDVGPADDVTTSFVLMTGGYVRPRWAVTEKVSIQGNLEYNIWRYSPVPVQGATEFTHHQRLIGASILYRPTLRTLLQAGYNREVRTSTLQFADYEVNVGFIEGRIGF